MPIKIKNCYYPNKPDKINSEWIAMSAVHEVDKRCNFFWNRFSFKGEYLQGQPWTRKRIMSIYHGGRYG